MPNLIETLRASQFDHCHEAADKIEEQEEKIKMLRRTLAAVKQCSQGHLPDVCSCCCNNAVEKAILSTGPAITLTFNQGGGDNLPL